MLTYADVFGRMRTYADWHASAAAVYQKFHLTFILITNNSAYLGTSRYFGQLDESKTMGNILKGLDELSEDPQKQSVCVRRYIEVTLTY
jgi:hypothetical protein